MVYLLHLIGDFVRFTNIAIAHNIQASYPSAARVPLGCQVWTERRYESNMTDT